MFSIKYLAKVKTVKRHPLLVMPVTNVLLECKIHTLNIRNGIYYISNDKITLDFKTYKLDKIPKRPVCILFTWFLASHKQIMKYADLYLEQGFDVIRVACNLWQILLPQLGTKVIGNDLMKLLAANECPLVLHGFSMGGYTWAVALHHALNNKKIYQPILNRVEAQIWDSIIDINSIAYGATISLYPKNRLLRYLSWLLLSCYFHTPCMKRHHNEMYGIFYTSPCRAPSLFLMSDADFLSPTANVMRVCNLWQDIGIQCESKSWSDSKHVAHFKSYPEEYVRLIRNHIQNSISEQTATQLKMSPKKHS